jgi:starch synthase
MFFFVMRVLLASPEAYPLAKTGGLADVCAALPAALALQGAEVRLIVPGYESALGVLQGARVAADFGALAGVEPARLLLGTLPNSGVTAFMVDCPALYRRPGGPYHDPEGRDWPDNDLRFGAFCHAIARLAGGEGANGWQVDAVHCHDWQTGLLPYLIRKSGGRRPRTIFTIHNAAFQGNFPLGSAARLGLPLEVLCVDGMEFYGQLSFLKAGIRYADRITTVSPTYARELLTPEFGFGMEGIIRSRAADFVGILNGIDTELWNPATDRHIAERYSRANAVGKAACKADLQRGNGMNTEQAAPVVSFASRLSWQKMADVVLERLPRLLESHPRMQFAMVAEGEPALEQGFARVAARFPGRVGVRGYSEALEHRLHAGADILLHGSRFEPCGLAQMYAMRYGALPVVRRVGGLADTVTDGENGFVFDEASGEALEGAVRRALGAYDSARWTPLREQAMSAEFDWQGPARLYLELYAGARGKKAPPGALPGAA